MRMDGRRESSNVDDRRRLSGGGKAGLGIGGLIIVALITWFMGGNVSLRQRKRNWQSSHARYWQAPRMYGQRYSSSMAEPIVLQRWCCLQAA